MKHLNDPQQNSFFDFFAGLLPDQAYQRLQLSWPHLFRTAILRILPAQRLGAHFSPDLGRPTKELYSMAGLIFLMEFKNWTCEQAAEAYTFHLDVQYALKLDDEKPCVCLRTVERYRALFLADEMAAEIMAEVTDELVLLLDLDVRQQRLDSTHLESNMASFGRTQAMGIAIKRFLTQLKRHDEAGYQALPEELRQRYEPSRHALFGDWSREAAQREAVKRQVAEDLLWLIERFTYQKQHRQRSTFRMLLRMFNSYCEVVESKVCLKKEPGGNVVVNPSDPDATMDGHKGAGYQVQLSETCVEGNEVQLIMAALPQTACAADGKALRAVLAQLEDRELKPTEWLADTSYGGDANYKLCKQQGVELVAPTCGKAGSGAIQAEQAKAADEPGRMLTEADFVIDHAKKECTDCPAGLPPHRSYYDGYQDHHHVMMLATTCKGCPLRARCPIKKDSCLNEIRLKQKKGRLRERRVEEQTEGFRRRYRLRSGIESTNSLLKRVTGLGRLRVRGRRAVEHAVWLKVAGWNILRAAKAWSSCPRCCSPLLSRLGLGWITALESLRVTGVARWSGMLHGFGAGEAARRCLLRWVDVDWRYAEIDQLKLLCRQSSWRFRGTVLDEKGGHHTVLLVHGHSSSREIPRRR